MIDSYIEEFNKSKTKEDLIKVYNKIKVFCHNEKEKEVLDSVFNYYFHQTSISLKESILNELTNNLFALVKENNINIKTITILCNEYNFSYNYLIDLLEKSTKNIDISQITRQNYNIVLFKIRKILLEEGYEVNSDNIRLHNLKTTTNKENKLLGLFYKYRSNFSIDTQEAIKMFGKFKDKKDLFMFFLQVKKNQTANSTIINRLTEIFNSYYDKLERDIDLVEVAKKINKAISENYFNKEYVDSLCDLYNISFNNLISLVNEEITNNNLNSKLRGFYNKLSYRLTEVYIKNNCIESRSIEQGKILLSTQMEYNIYNNIDFANVIKCPINAYQDCLNVLKNIKHPVYQDFIVYKKENLVVKRNVSKEDTLRKQQYLEEIETLNKDELIDYLKKASKQKMIVFCELYDLSYVPFSYIKGIDDTFITTIVNNLSNIKETFNNYCVHYQNIISSVVKEINDSNNMYNLYDHYERYGIDLYKLKQLAINFRKVDEYTILEKYILKNPSSVYILDMNELETLNYLKYLSCNNETICFDNNILNSVIADLEEKKFPMIKGLIFEGIKRNMVYQKKLTKN